ncbi:MAG: AAA family ATPase [Planctomycetota bacterium]|jgi:ATP-dependent Clp protease ATP-binding subunit ClpA
MKDKKLDPNEVLAQWTERDLTKEVRSQQLPRAYEMDGVVEGICEVIESGHGVIVAGESGMGRTAVIYEVLYRLHDDLRAHRELLQNRFLQFCLQRQVSTLAKRERIHPEMMRLTRVLQLPKTRVIPYFRDFHNAYSFDLESLFESLSYQLGMPVLLESDELLLRKILENYPEIEQQYTIFHIDEPNLNKVELIVDRWSKDGNGQRNSRFTPQALNSAIHLTHRFLGRSRMPRKVFDLLHKVNLTCQGTEPIDEQVIYEQFCSRSRVPEALVNPRIKLDHKELEQEFNHQLIGQTEAVQAVTSMISIIKAGLSDVNRPFGVFLFVGPTGVGKTYMARLLAEYLFGHRDCVIRLNMADYQKDKDALTLFGNPEAHYSNQMQGELTKKFIGNPFGVILLDEFEKADKAIHDRFLQLFDEGSFINGSGQSISCRSMIIIATSNTGSEVYQGKTFGFYANHDLNRLKCELTRKLKEHFRIELLNRFDRIVHFHPLSEESIMAITRKELEQIKDRPGMKKMNLEIEFNDHVIRWVAENGYNPEYGVRYLHRTIEQNLTTAIANLIVRDPAGSMSKIRLSNSADRIEAHWIG